MQMSIATSRALGDFDFKSNPSRQPEEQMISPVPELYTRRRQAYSDVHGLLCVGCQMVYRVWLDSLLMTAEPIEQYKAGTRAQVAVLLCRREIRQPCKGLSCCAECAFLFHSRRREQQRCARLMPV